jgi:hypothetical protein
MSTLSKLPPILLKLFIAAIVGAVSAVTRVLAEEFFHLDE